MLRGEVYWVDFDPSMGGEIQKRRPAVILSNNAANRALNRVLVVPLTSQTSRMYPGETIVRVRGRESKAMADQLTTASKLRVGAYIDTLEASDLRSLERVVSKQLGFGA